MKGVLRDISMTGAKISLADALAPGTIVTLIFGIPNSVPLRVVQFKARIVRQTPDGYGIAFWEMDPATRAFVHNFTQR
jgi:c-di-GMP-binding flagellar brake protein YcgR